jgi:D-sedoheptulose 7-phosphate isomerase
MTTKEIIKSELQKRKRILEHFISDDEAMGSIDNAAALMVARLKHGGKIIAMGNGGSMSDAIHFVTELTGKYKDVRPPIPALAISDPGYLSCVANDFGYDEVFKRFLQAHATENDVVLCLTTSGKSRNILEVLDLDNDRDYNVVLITGGRNPFNPNAVNPASEMLGVADIEINIPSNQTDNIQEVTIVVLHILVHLIEKGLGYA